MIISYKLLVSICKDIKKIPLEQILNAFNCVGIEFESCRKHPKNSGLKIVKIKYYHVVLKIQIHHMKLKINCWNIWQQH